MNTFKKHFVERVNEVGILTVRERNSKEDLTGWGALEFILNNGEVFVIWGRQFGQGSEEDGLWIDMNKIGIDILNKLKQKTSRIRRRQKKDTITDWLEHQTMKTQNG